MLFVFLFECAAANFNKRIGYMEKEKGKYQQWPTC